MIREGQGKLQILAELTVYSHNTEKLRAPIGRSERFTSVYVQG